MNPDWDAMVVVGRIARAHGIRGQVIVNPESDFPEARFREGNTLFVSRHARVEALQITTARFHQDRPVIGLRGVETMNEAEALSGAELRVPAEDLQPLPSGSYYRHDLVGCRVIDRSGAEIGHVARVEGPVDGSRLVVVTSGEEVLVPMAANICIRIDPAAREIVIDPPDGLLDLNASRRRS